ncbi:CAP domain-containing protein [Corynebacterium aurimucosum]|uniref:CAP domain-containing protein n=1 Tax=Corynebacterium aurimucosum TaxID=169292 RepID=A0A558GJW6_9CORY|nr:MULTISPECIES: hypothetical protein [Corynebacterium]OFP22038.1 hypothetical protein HMPREF2996_02785 [Corynebacterium sp. HMSC066C02]OFQ32242.1 hypothetical protein HMPREF2943_07135 [Corynebacterium sp. HMSC072D12]OFS37540.1 hypothetical protein HMPREF2896_10235 [Corynebacterium sp. HMSC069E04]QQU96480.1 hypothetical protein I6I66_05160 [Corynebacterium aurimucosum]TVU57138.1 CAP domain-containing protein [Corynebacterium aurimucosum]
MNSFTLPPAVTDILAGRQPAKEDVVLLLQRILTVLVLGGTLVTAVISLTNPSDDGSSTDAEPPTSEACDYELPDVPVQRQLATIQEELMEGLNEWRKEDGQAPLVPWIDRQTAAREKAECNAVTKTQDSAEENVQMVQHHLPLEEASGYQFMEAFLASPDHVAALRDRRMSTAAVGVAYNDGEVYVVIQLEE